MSDVVLELKDVLRSFKQGGETLQVLRGANLTISRGEVVALVGPSGSGKSTFLQIAGLLERPDEGDVKVNGESCGHFSDDKRTELRRTRLGFVYQFHHLLPEFSAEENIILPQMIAGRSRADARVRAHELLAAMNLSARADHRPGQLSGGEQQRIAIARALANRPAVLLADEPTSNLDLDTSDFVFAELVAIARKEGLAALIVTHNPALAARMDRTVRLDHGLLAPV